METIYSNFSVPDALAVKSVERVTNHDVKAVEYVLKDKCRSHPELEKVLWWWSEGRRFLLRFEKF